MNKNKVVALVLIVIAALIAIYPTLGTLYNNKRLDDLSEEYQDKISVEPLVNTNKEALDRAEEYNEWLKAHPFTPPPIGQDYTHEEYSRYDGILKEPNNTMGTITIPDIDVRLPIYHGTAGDTLYKGAGHLYGTALPVGGQGQTSVITAHSGMVDASMFDNLPKLKPGQKAYIQVRDRKLAYVMVDSKTVSPDATDAIPHDDRDLLVLITCTPYGINTSRLVVTLERTELDDEDIPQTSNSVRTWQWWMTALVVLWGLLILVFVVFYRRDKSRASATKRPVAQRRRVVVSPAENADSIRL